MPILVNSTQIKTLNVNTTQAKKAYANNVLVYSADETIFENGVEAEGLVKDNFSLRTSADLVDGYGNNNCLECVVQATLDDWEYKHGYVQFDFTDFSRVEIEFLYPCWARYAVTHVWCGIDNEEAEDLGEASYYSETEIVTRTYDTSLLTGDHKFMVKLSLDSNTSDNTNVSNIHFIIRKIVGYV
jgi:hypothetical protein